jgi:ADP-dependent phosphofructokinase/glucokinase
MGERIVLGLGDNTDYEISWDSRVVERLIVDQVITAADLGTDGPISTVRDLVVSILGFMARGTGGERFVQSPQVIEDLARMFKYRVTIGGTSVRAAIAMRKLGYRSALHLVTMNDHVRRLLPQDSPWVCSRPDDSSFPHLIVQFGQGIAVKAGDINIVTSRPNRIIYDNDDDNIEMRLSPQLGALAADARVFLISGFNAMRSLKQLADRLQTLRGVLSGLPSDVTVFFEDAGYHLPETNQLVLKALAGFIDIHSLNEDELQGYLNRFVDLLDSEAVLAALKDLSALLAVPTVVVHTQHWALAYDEDPARFAPALRGAITMAASRFRFGDDFTAADYRATDTLPPQPAAAVFAAEVTRLGNGKVCCLPSRNVKETKVTTVGLGDAFVGGFLPHLLEVKKPVFQASRSTSKRKEFP